MSAPDPDDLPGGVLSIADDLRILAANRMIGELVGRAPGDLVDNSLDILLSAPSRILLQTNVYPALKAEGRVEEVFLTLAAADGTTIPVLFNAALSARPGPPTYDVLVVRIHARARWERELLAATRALETERAASQRLADELSATAADLTARHAAERRDREFRDAFIGVISHELRTPITTIYGMSHILSERHESMDPDAVRQHLHDIESESDRLQRLTEDLLVLSRAEGGGLAVADDPVIVGHVVRTAIEGERRRSPDRQIDSDIAPSLPLVTGEHLYLEQVVRNFLSNAAKYSPAGAPISVVAREEEDGAAVRVTDSGPGLGEEAPDQLFELFYRAPGAVRQASGAGIGLFVCRELVQAMGGRIWATPASTGGAEFGFWLPAAAEVDDGES